MTGTLPGTSAHSSSERIALTSRGRILPASGRLGNRPAVHGSNGVALPARAWVTKKEEARKKN